MGDWKTFANKTKELLNSKDTNAAKEEIAIGLEKFSHQPNLLNIATDVYRALDDHETSLKYANLLIIHHPKNWNGYGRAAQDLVELSRFHEAQTTIQTGLEKLPNQLNLLNIAADVYRASGDREKSLEYAKLLITHYPDHWNGYGRSAQDLVALKRFKEAQEKIQTGLGKLPNQLNLLNIAADVYRASGDREKSLEYAELLIDHHPTKWQGYARIATDLIALKRFEEASRYIDLGIKTNNHPKLAIIKSNLQNDIENINLLCAMPRNLYPKETDISKDPKEKHSGKNGRDTFCFLIRCTHYKDPLAQQLRDQITKHVSSANVWFVHDSDEQDKTINLISVRRFRQSVGIDWSIIGRKGWLFGDFCYYAAIHSGLNFDKYYLIEDDVRFTGDALPHLLLEIENEEIDFLCAKYGERSFQSWNWLRKYSYSHPSENAEVGCLFPFSRASKQLIEYLFNKRIDEFQRFYETHQFTSIEANKYFSNDEAFTSNATHNSNHFTISSIPKSFTDRYFSLNTISDIGDIKGDHIIHRYCPNQKVFTAKIKKLFNGKLVKAKKQEDFKIDDFIYNTCVQYAKHVPLSSDNIPTISEVLRLLYSKHSDSNFDLLRIPDFLQVLSSCPNIGRIKTGKRLDDSESLIYNILNATISPRVASSASIKNLNISTINNLSLLKIINQIHLPYSFEDKKLHYIATNSSAVDSGFLYMNQRADGKFLVTKELEKIKPINFNPKHLILVFSQGRCGSTLMSNLLRHFDITSISECDALTQAKGNETAIKRIIESFYSSAAIGSPKIAFKFRAGTCGYIKSYLKAYPHAQFLFIKRSRLDWAKSYSSKFNWSAEQMSKTYLNTFKCSEVLAKSNSNVLFLDYDSNSKWPDQLLSCKGIMANPESYLSTKSKLLEEFGKDSQTGFIDNTKKSFNESEVMKFMSMKLPSYSW